MPDPRMIKKMFGVDTEPFIPLSLGDIPLKAQDMVGKMSISGAQPKLPLRLNKREGKLEAVAQGGEYILKPSQQVYPNIPENENCCMDIATELGFDVPPHCLLPLKDGTLAYVVKRFDREGEEKIHTETFYQLLEKDSKYAGSIEQIGKKLEEISSVPGLDSQLFFERVLLDFLIWNGDGHSKNYSIIRRDTDTRLAPAYDLVCTKLVIPGDTDFALTLRGKKNRIAREDFVALANELEIPERVRFERFENRQNDILQIVKDSRLPAESKERMSQIIGLRYRHLGIQ